MVGWVKRWAIRADHGPQDHGFVAGGEAFVVADSAAVLANPGEGSFYDPAAGQDLEGVRVAPGDDLDSHLPGCCPGAELAGVDGIGPDQADAAVMTTASSGPVVSTAMFRLRT